MFDPRANIGRSIGPEKDNCVGYGLTGSASNYWLALNIGVGVDKIKLGHGGSQVLDEINVFDQAEVDGAYLGQSNMITVSSFCGPRGLIWGYDAAIPDDLYQEHRLLTKKWLSANGINLPVYSADPLTRATKALFGTVGKKVFPLLPGTHLPCATNNIKRVGPTVVYAAIGVGIAKDRSKAASVMMEDVGEMPVGLTAGERDQYKQEILGGVVKSIIQIADNQRSKYREVFVGIKEVEVPVGQIGCALVAAPYFLMAKHAVVGRDPKLLLGMSLEMWQNGVGKIC